MKRLKDYAKEQGVQYRTAWNRYKAGKIAGAFQNEFGQILIDESPPESHFKRVYKQLLIYKSLCFQ